MGYKSLVDASLRQAFNQAKDLVETVTVSASGNKSFDFNAGAVQETFTSVTLTALVLTISRGARNRAASKHSVERLQLLLKTADVGNIHTYDIITARGNIYKLGPVMKSDGFMTTFEVYREL